MKRHLALSWKIFTFPEGKRSLNSKNIFIVSDEFLTIPHTFDGGPTTSLLIFPSGPNERSLDGCEYFDRQDTFSWEVLFLIGFL